MYPQQQSVEIIKNMCFEILKWKKLFSTLMYNFALKRLYAFLSPSIPIMFSVMLSSDFLHAWFIYIIFRTYTIWDIKLINCHYKVFTHVFPCNNVTLQSPEERLVLEKSEGSIGSEGICKLYNTKILCVVAIIA
jgi:hypothetical protein